MRVRRFLSLLAATAVVAAGVSTTGVAAADPGSPPADPLCTDTSAPVHLRVGYFGKSPLVSVAIHEGFLDAQNVSADFLTVQGSTYQFEQLEAGSGHAYAGSPGTDLILTASDNVANYRLNASNALGRTLPVKAIAATDGGYNLQLLATKDIATVAQLKGKVLGVDADNSGFAFIAYDILAKHGLAAPAWNAATGRYESPDYGIRAIGGVGNRYFNITGAAPTVSATLLSNGFDILGTAKGLNGFEDVRNVTSPYLSGVLAGLDPWLAANRCAAVRFTRALEGAAQFTTDPANASAVTGDIQMDAPSFVGAAMDRAAYAQAYYAVAVTPVIGQYSRLEIDPRGLYNVLALRKKYDGYDQAQNLLLLSTPFGGLYSEEYALTAEVGRVHQR